MKRVPGLRYDVLDELLGYPLRRAQLAMFGAFDEATRGLRMTPPRFTAMVVIGANPGLSQTLLGRVFFTWFNPGPCTGYVFAVANLAAGLPVGWGALYAWSRFVPGRSYEVADMIANAIGASVAVALVWAWSIIRRL